jgi:hypothetical protein
MKQQQLKLGAFMRPIRIHTGAWRYPGAFLHENLGLPRPETRFFPAQTPARRAASPARAHSHS